MRLLYIIYQICIGLPLFLVATVITTIVTIVGCRLGDGNFWGYYPGHLWSVFTCRVFLLPISVTGRENIDKDTSYVFVANHQGSFDIFLIYGFLHRNFKWMMKQSLRNVPMVGKASEAAGFIFVDKSSPRKIVETIKKAEKVLQGGTSMVVFPEGARTYTGRMRDFKKGAFLMADQLQLPVVPLTIDGAFEVMPRTSHLLSWHPMKLTIHPPVYPTGKKGEENLQKIMTESYAAIESALPEKHQNKK